MAFAGLDYEALVPADDVIMVDRAEVR